MFTLPDDIEFLNLPEQVQKNVEDIAKLQELVKQLCDKAGIKYDENDSEEGGN